MTSFWAPPDGRWIYLPSGPGEQTALEVTEVLAEGQTKFQHYLVVETPAFGRVLVLDGQIQSSEYDEWIYHEALVAPAMCVAPAPKRVAVLGGGEGAMLREALRHPTVEHLAMVDIDGDVVKACHDHLQPFHQGAFGDPRVTVLADDARAWLERADHGGNFDVILVDLTEPLAGGPSCKLFTQEFYELVRDALAPGGVMALQAGPVRPGMSWAYGRVVHTLGEVFDHVVPYTAWITSFFEEWGFAVAGGPVVAELSPALVDRRLAERRIEPRFLDGVAWSSAVLISSYIRSDIDDAEGPFTDLDPPALKR